MGRLGRKDYFEYNRLKFFSYVITHYNDFEFSKFFTLIDKKSPDRNISEYRYEKNDCSYKELKAAKKLKETDLEKIKLRKRKIIEMPLNFIDVLNSYHMRIFDTHVKDLKYYKEAFETIVEYVFEAYFLIKGLSKKYLEKHVFLPDKYDTELIKKIFGFLFEHNYLIIYKKDKKNYIYKILYLGIIENYEKSIPQNYGFVNNIDVSLTFLSKTLCNMTLIANKQKNKFKAGNIEDVNTIQKIKTITYSKDFKDKLKSNFEIDFNTYQTIISTLLNISLHLNKSRCYLCDLSIKQNSNKDKICRNCQDIITGIRDFTGVEKYKLKKGVANIKTSIKKRQEYLLKYIEKFKGHKYGKNSKLYNDLVALIPNVYS